LSATAPRRKKSAALDSFAPQRRTERDLARELDREIAGVSVTPELFEKFQRLIHEEAGIWLGEAKSALLCGRLSRRLRALQIPTLDRYYEIVVDPYQYEERVAMIDAITTNETRFFRDPRHFEILEARAIPRWRAEAQQGIRSKTVRIWSAGCSSGEEPYSLAMLLARHLPVEQGWNATVLATDISTRVLAHARQGIYGIAKSSDIPAPLLKDYMLKGIDRQDGQMKVMPEIQAMVDFHKLNLIHGPYPPEAHFDAVFCRNVLIYFDLQAKQKAVEHLTRCLAPSGLFFVGQAENLATVNSSFRTLAGAVYVRDGEQSGY
jgi:chemotaxis protein methyltransferase CheR